jgi:hypothetical protein
MKKFFSVTLALVLVAGLLPIVGTPSAVAAADVGGYGSGGKFLQPIGPIANGSIPIGNKTDLAKIGQDPLYPLNGRYHLTSDIAFDGIEEWEPIAQSMFDTPFSGIFDGQGHIISNLRVTGVRDFAGLFGYSVGASFINIGFEDTFIEITSGIFVYAGAVAGRADNARVASNCFNTGNIKILTASSAYAGGIFGGYSSSLGTLNYCYNTGDISSSAIGTHSIATGISNSGAEITNSFNTGSITASGTAITAYAGGIGGYTVSRSYNTGNVSAMSERDSAWYVYAGGISSNANRGSVTNCYNTGDVFASANTGTVYVGGINGRSVQGSIDRSYSTGNVSAAYGTSAAIHAGAVCGHTAPSGAGTPSPTVVSNSYWNIESEQTINGIPISVKKGIGTGLEDTVSLTSTQMKIASNFAGFDFDTIWDINPDINSGYPFLRLVTDGVTDTPPATTVTIHSTTPDNAVINLSTETVHLPDGFTPFSYNTAISAKWVRWDRLKDQRAVSRLFNRGITLRIMGRYAGSDDSVTITFPKIDARPKRNADKLKPFYGDENWVLAKKGSTAAVFAGLEYAPSANGKTPDGNWLPLPQDGLPVLDSRATVLVRTAPTASRAASTAWRVRPAVFGKAPNYKVKNDEITVKAGTYVKLPDGTVTLHREKKKIPVVSGMEVWNAATGKRPAGLRQVV